MAQWNPIVFMYRVCISCSFAGGHLGWFYFLALVKRRRRNRGVAVSDAGHQRGPLRPSTPALKQHDYPSLAVGNVGEPSGPCPHSCSFCSRSLAGSELIKTSSAWQGGNSTDALWMPSASDGDTNLQSTGDTKPTLCCPRLGLQSTKCHHDCP